MYYILYNIHKYIFIYIYIYNNTHTSMSRRAMSMGAKPGSPSPDRCWKRLLQPHGATGPSRETWSLGLGQGSMELFGAKP